MSPGLGVTLIATLALVIQGELSQNYQVTMAMSDESFDWRKFGVITPVYDQGMMDNVMDFVITEGMESVLAIQTKTKAIHLSVEEVGACCDNEGHQPKYPGFDCIKVIGGLCTPETYQNDTGSCNNRKCKPVVKVTGSGYIPAGREDFMLKVIHTTPIVALVDASQQSFQTYTAGVYSDPRCSSTQVDHAVQVVGYGSDGGLDYWIVRNTWGVGWGEQGYMRILRGKNMCGIAAFSFYPLFKHA
ncbi:procathepsin L-like [Physella acuta]|uniref:procathepsin L-like n=1 Tax=Physella acuta TaxID=109671 RepID=UPI0027DC3CCA|nr:procathepsin L-like [Physella acuta]